MYISVIIPTLNRAESLRLTLDSLVKQKDVNCEYEVIVVDNGSSDHTASVCEEFSSRIVNFQRVYDSIPGQLTGRHKGMELSKGSILAYLDDDVELNEWWVRSLSDITVSHPQVSIFGGPSTPIYESTAPDWLDDFWETPPPGGSMCLPLSLIDLQKDLVEIDPLYVFGLNFCIRKNDLLQLKGFHPDCIISSLQHFQGDGETGLAIKAGTAGKKAIHAKGLALRHHIPASRLTEAYFKQWSFYNGVCQSFTDLRFAHGLYTGNNIKLHGAVNQDNRFLTSIFRIIRKFLKKLLSSGKNDSRPDMSESYLDGYRFHQENFASNRTVRNWVLKDDYFDYALPCENVRK